MTTPKLLGALAAVALLAACGSDSTADQAATGTGGAGVGRGAARPGSQEDLVANIGDRVFFDTDRSNIRADQRPVLDRQAGWMRQHPQVQVQVEGPTFAPNGRVLMFWRESRARDARGSGFSSRLVSIDITGFNERAVETPTDASDPAWSPLLS